MTFAEVRGQDHALGVLRRALDRDRLAHALIFAGPAGVGKRATARALACAILCHVRPGRGCGECEDCHLVDVGAHPDLFVEDLERAREERPAATRLSIDQMRRVRSQLALRAVRGNRKVGWIDQAELLTTDAQNALLKTLEEPPGRTTLVLLATNHDALLATIRSRCQSVRFAPLECDLISEILASEGVEAETARQAAALSDGSLDRARTLASEAGLEHAADLRTKLADLPRTPLERILDLAAELAGPRGDKGRAQQALSRATVLAWCRERLIEAVAATAAREGTNEEAADERLDGVRIALRRAERAYAIDREFDQNANLHLAWDRLLLDLRELR